MKLTAADPYMAELVRDRCIDLRELMSCVPEDYGLALPEEGAWIIVKDPPHTALEWEVPFLSIFRATPFYRARTFRLPLGPRGGRHEVRWPSLRAVIQTPGGELHLFPDEYGIVRDIATYVELVGAGVDLHFMGAGEPGEFAEQVFYLQAHGIARRDALLLLLPHLADDNFVYFTIDPRALDLPFRLVER